MDNGGSLLCADRSWVRSPQPAVAYDDIASACLNQRYPSRLLPAQTGIVRDRPTQALVTAEVVAGQGHDLMLKREAVPAGGADGAGVDCGRTGRIGLVCEVGDGEAAVAGRCEDVAYELVGGREGSEEEKREKTTVGPGGLGRWGVELGSICALWRENGQEGWGERLEKEASAPP